MYLFVIPPAAGMSLAADKEELASLGQKLVVYNGQALLLELGGGPEGFKDVCFQNDRQRNRPYYAKFTPDGQRGQRRLPQSNSKTAQEAACKLAIFKLGKQELPEVEFHCKRRPSEVSDCGTLSLIAHISSPALCVCRW